MKRENILAKAITKAEANGYLPDAYALMAIDGGVIEPLIYSHSFAKAFWGEGEESYMGVQLAGKAVWQHHLQRMVLEEDPLKYLEKFL